ncbi:MAG TPA: acetolactate synthase large subunit [Burkholderiales bacterium]|nr:acetolactate synthase large subunit [Burkholderiales bacterium]
MNGAQSLVRTLVANGVNVCFTNPGTSEMHFVAALDKVEGMRCVLGLFEGVVTGAADGYYRMTGRPACTLLHLGPGLGNGLANLHNAKKARSGIVNIVGEHATYHLKHDAPLTADIAGIARPVSHWIHTATSARTLAMDCASAIQQARMPPGQIATLIAPADTAWGEAEAPARAESPPARKMVARDAVSGAARALTDGAPAMLLLGGAALRGRALEDAGRIAAKTGCRLMSEYNNARMEGGAGRVKVDRLPYPVDQAFATLKGVRRLVLAGAKVPVSFFAYPGKPSVLTPEDCVVTKLADAEDDLAGALSSLVAALDATRLSPAHVNDLARPALPSGKVTPDGIACTLAALLPDDAIVIDESVTTGRNLGTTMASAPPHDWLNIMGGSIGWALPAATGAAIGAPERKVVALEGDGSGMYTLQALWTMARENLDVTVVVLANRSYQILHTELRNMGAGTPGQRAADMLTLDRPHLDWVSLARGLGVEGGRATTLDEFAGHLASAFSRRGPYLVELVF